MPLAATPLSPLIASALRNTVAALLIIAGVAAGITGIFQLPAGYAAQVLAVFSGLLLVLSPFLPHHRPLTRFGPANRVTLLRAGIAALLAGVVGRAAPEPGLAWLFAALAGLALLLDGVDGWLARRGGWQSAFGARFDLEIDAFFILTLSALVWQSGKADDWVLLSGGLRYGFVALGQILPWLNRPLPPRRRRQTVCVIQTAILAICLIPSLVPPWTTLLAASALLALIGSFAVDTVWLARHAGRESAPS